MKTLEEALEKDLKEEIKELALYELEHDSGSKIYFVNGMLVAVTETKSGFKFNYEVLEEDGSFIVY